MTTLLISLALNKLCEKVPSFTNLLPSIINSGKFVYAFDRVRIVNRGAYVGILYPDWKISKWIKKNTSLKQYIR